MDEANFSRNISYASKYIGKTRNKVINRKYNTWNHRNKTSFTQKRSCGYRYPKEELKYHAPKKIKTKKIPSRPISPVEGSEEYMNKKIEKTSAIIMRHLLSPDETIIPLRIDKKNDNSQKQLENESKSNIETKSNRKTLSNSNESSVSNNSHSIKSKKCPTYNVKEIHNKIMLHLTNLNKGRKKNLISNDTSAYDETIDQIVKQKRLEISRALRSVCLKSSDVTESTEWINSIIPDMGIKIEDLPQEVLEDLQMTFSNNEIIVDFNLPFGGAFPSRTFTHEKPENDNSEKHNDIAAPSEIVEILKSDILMNGSFTSADFDSKSDILDRYSETLFPIISDNLNQVSKNIEITHPNLTIASTSVNSGHLNENLSNNDTENVGKESPMEEENLILSPNSTEFDKTLDSHTGQQNTTILTPSLTNESTEIVQITVEDFLQRNFKDSPKTYSEAIERMLIIDKYVAKIVEYRQKLFTDLIDNNENAFQPLATTKEIQILEENQSKNCEIEQTPLNSVTEQKFLEFKGFHEKVLVLKVCEDTLLAATESGKVYFYKLENGNCENILNVTSVPISSLHFKNEKDDKPYLFVGACEPYLKVYNFYSSCLLQNLQLEDNIQCMDENWGYLFLGCQRGTILRYSIKKQQIEHEEQINSNPVLVLKATQEGARKVILIGSRNSPIIIRDAMNSLFLRKLDITYPTVYSINMHKNYVICGTTMLDILVFNFYNGKLEHTFKATEAKGVSCMKVIGKCLFASCYNGNIYVFNLETKSLVDTICGPGGVIISMEVLCNQVIVGTMSFELSSIPISHNILSEMY